MDLDQTLEIVAENFKNIDYYDFNKKLLNAIKRCYGIEDLYFYCSDDNFWWHCSEEDPKENYNLRYHPNIKVDPSVEEVLRRLTGWIKKGYGTGIGYDGQRFDTLEELKRHRLIRDLSGIL